MYPDPQAPPAQPPAPPAAPPDRDDDDEAEDPTAEDMAVDILDLESQRRRWLKSILPLLQLRSRESDPSPRVQFEQDMMHVAACARVRRILNSDQPDITTS